jgi:hypothetical protein
MRQFADPLTVSSRLMGNHQPLRERQGEGTTGHGAPTIFLFWGGETRHDRLT